MKEQVKGTGALKLSATRRNSCFQGPQRRSPQDFLQPAVSPSAQKRGSVEDLGPDLSTPAGSKPGPTHGPSLRQQIFRLGRCVICG